MVDAIGLRVEAADDDAATAIIGKGEKLPGARQFEDAPTAMLEDCLRRTPPRFSSFP